MKKGTETKAKFKKLQRRLDLPLWQCVGLLETLWHITAQDAPRGDIGRLSNEDIAATLGYSDDEDDLIRHLVECEWLLPCARHRLVVSGWSEHAPNYIKGFVKEHKGGFAHQVPETPTKTPLPETPLPETRVLDPSLDPSLDPTPPNLTKPNLTNTLDTSASAEVCEDPPAWVFLTRNGRWKLPETKLNEYLAAYSIDVETELRKAAMWLADNPPRRKTAGGMKAFLTRWLNSAQDDATKQINGSQQKRDRLSFLDTFGKDQDE